MKRLAYFIVALCSLCYTPPLMARDKATYPAPVSEYAEQTGPNTMTFLSYPKYYRNAFGNLTEVDTTLVESSNPDCDYEVTRGIWTLRVRTDGTFQAEHEGNVFSYRLHSIGLGRGNGYKPFQWGEPNCSNVSLMGDTIRWAEVFPDVDLAVRYIHDILKVDVILKRALMDRIRSDVKNGYLNRDEFVTARFEIPNALVTGEARQGGRIRDIFGEEVEIDQPLYFEKNGIVIHKLRPVRVIRLNEEGIPVEDEIVPVRTAQTWRLRPDGLGSAEMSANLGDVAIQPDGAMAIDPGMTFGPSRDTVLKNNDSYPYGSWDIVEWKMQDRPILGFDISSIGSGMYITSAKLNIYAGFVNLEAGKRAQAFKVTSFWAESYANWYKRDGAADWTTAGGDYDANIYGPPAYLPSASQQWFTLDVTTPLNSHYQSTPSHASTKGLLLRILDVTTKCLNLYLKEYANVNLRPKLDVIYHCGCATTGGSGTTLTYHCNVYLSPYSFSFLLSNGGISKVYAAASEAEWVVRNPHPDVPDPWDYTANISYVVDSVNVVSSQEMLEFNLTEDLDSELDLIAWENYLCTNNSYVRVAVVNSSPGWVGIASLENCNSATRLGSKGDPYRGGFLLRKDTFTSVSPGWIWAHEHGHTVGSFNDISNPSQDALCPYNMMSYQMGPTYHGLIYEQANAYYTAGERDGCPKGGDPVYTPAITCP
ncbi:MAG: DNRLRE domain-containing protein [Candidatus Omnitrophica bacterium]|nr:DNRLRE domain-containing protein [Candidatus Omnitrophota bacterium]